MSWQNRIVGYDTKPANQFTANPLNWRTHPNVQREALRGLLGEVGWVGAVLENKRTGNVVDGHARIEEALSKDENAPIPYLLVDLSEEEERLVLASFDPISALANSDKERLELLLKDLSSSSEAVDSLLRDVAKKNGVSLSSEPKDAEPQIDKAEELRLKWGTEMGQLWAIGNHRLLVGDARNKTDVESLCVSEKADILFTDPPYGIDRDEGFEGFEGFGGFGTPIARRRYKGDWDSERPAKETFDLMLDSSKKAIIFGGNYFADLLPQSKHWIVWDKLNTMPTFGDCELAWTNMSRTSVKKYTIEYNGLIGKEKERFHATQKPLALFIWVLKDYSRGVKTVLDPFVGSGTTLLACENLDLKCYAMDADASCVAVTLERMSTAFPHLRIELVQEAHGKAA